MTDIFDKSHYYYLLGTTAKLEAFFLGGKNKSSSLCYNQGEALPIRITKVTAGIFLALVSLPLTIIGLGINRFCRQKIDPKIYQKEFDQWNRIFYHHNHAEKIKELTYETLRTGSVEIIDHLIKSRVKAAECPFDRILVHLWSRTSTENLFYPDGVAYGMKPLIEQEKRCLVIVSPREGEAIANKRRLTIGWDKEHLNFSELLKQSYHYTNESAMIKNDPNQYISPDKLAKVNWLWLEKLEQMPRPNLFNFLR